MCQWIFAFIPCNNYLITATRNLEPAWRSMSDVSITVKQSQNYELLESRSTKFERCDVFLPALTNWWSQEANLFNSSEHSRGQKQMRKDISRHLAQTKLQERPWLRDRSSFHKNVFYWIEIAQRKTKIDLPQYINKKTNQRWRRINVTNLFFMLSLYLSTTLWRCIGEVKVKFRAA